MWHPNSWAQAKCSTAPQLSYFEVVHLGQQLKRDADNKDICTSPCMIDLCILSLISTSLHLYCQCLYAHILILTQRVMNSKNNLKSTRKQESILTLLHVPPNTKLNSDHHLKHAVKPHWFCHIPSTCFSFVCFIWILHSQWYEICCHNSAWYFSNNYCCFMGERITKFQWLRIPGLIAFCRMSWR